MDIRRTERTYFAYRKQNSSWNRSLAYSAAFLALLLLAMLAILGYLAWRLCYPSIAALQSDPMQSIGLSYETIRFDSADGDISLHGWYIPANAHGATDQPSQKTVIFSHGYGGNREENWVPIYDLAAAVHGQYHNVLMFDYGYVSSKRRPVTAGLSESKELLGAVHYAKSRKAAEVYIWGFSMGAGTALQAALEDPSDITGMILDSTFLLEPDSIARHWERRINLPPYPALYFLRPMISAIGGVKPHHIPYDQVKKTTYPMPLLIIHGLKDNQAPSSVAVEIASHQSDPLSQLWLASDRGHEMIYRMQPNMYLRKTLHYLAQVSSR